MTGQSRPPLAPGNPGNPKGGRPRLTDATREARTLAQNNCAAAIRRLIEIMNTSDDDRAVIVACEAILNRGMGRPEAAPAIAAPSGGTRIVVEMPQWSNAAPPLALTAAIVEHEDGSNGTNGHGRNGH